MEPRLLLTKNRDIPPITGAKLQHYLHALDTKEGVKEELVWQLLDACDCGHWFMKQALLEEHVHVCPYWYGVELAYNKLKGMGNVPAASALQMVEGLPEHGTIKASKETLPLASAKPFKKMTTHPTPGKPPRDTVLSILVSAPVQMAEAGSKWGTSVSSAIVGSGSFSQGYFNDNLDEAELASLMQETNSFQF